MQRRVLGYLLVTALLLGVTTIAAACGDGEEELSLAEYFQKLETISADLEQRGETIGSELGVEFDPETGELPSIDTLRRLLNEGTSAFQDSLNDIESLDPPSEAESAHDEFMEAARDRVEFIESLVDEVLESESASDLLDLLTQVAPESQQQARFKDACRALERIAVEKGIQVDLDCE